MRKLPLHGILSSVLLKSPRPIPTSNMGTLFYSENSPFLKAAGGMLRSPPYSVRDMAIDSKTLCPLGVDGCTLGATVLDHCGRRNRQGKHCFPLLLSLP